MDVEWLAGLMKQLHSSLCTPAFKVRFKATHGKITNYSSRNAHTYMGP